MTCPHNFAVKADCLLCRIAYLEAELAAEVALADRLAEALSRYGRPVGFDNPLSAHAARVRAAQQARDGKR